MPKEAKTELWKVADWAFLSLIGYFAYQHNPALGTLAMVFACCRYFQCERKHNIGD